MQSPNRHLGPETLRRLASGDWSPRPGQIAHLVDCDSCAVDLIQLFPQGAERRVYELLDEPDGPRSASDLPDLLCRLLAAYRQRRDAEATAAPKTVAALLEMSQEERLSAVQEQPAFATLPVAEGLLEEIPNWWHRDPHHAGDLAEVAISILQPLEDAAPLAVSPSRVLEGLSHAWALRGNALRIQGELAKAEESLQRAGELAEQTNCLFALGRVARLLAKLLRGQRRFDEARESCSEAEEIYTRVRDSQMVARTRILRASILGESGDHEDAVAVLQDLLASQSRQDMGEENFLAASQSLCHRLVQAGQPQEALVQLDKVESLISALSAPLARCRVSWVRALALAEIGDNLQSEALLRQVLKTFLDHEIPYDAALVGLDLAALYLRTGALSGARELAQELNPIFLSRGIHREATAAGLVATQALERESATMALLENVRHFLRNVRRDPTLSYRAFSD